MQQIEATGLVPAVRTSSAEEAVRAVEALREGGIAILEITMTVPGALGVIQDIAKRFESEVIVGAGTVLDPETARSCILAGARFIVAPSLNVDTISACHRYDIPIVPGALTPTEIETAWTAGADCVKVFPVSAVGGAAYIKAVKAPLLRVQLMPMGGVSLESVGDYIRAGATALGVGSDLVDVQALREKREDQITQRARQYLQAVQHARARNR